MHGYAEWKQVYSTHGYTRVTTFFIFFEEISIDIGLTHRSNLV